MIKLVTSGTYKLIETKNQVKILYLDGQAYAWVEPIEIGELLVYSHEVHKSDCILAIGDYRIYDVKDEPKLSDLQHLELEVGKNSWQGYLLLTGLPGKQKKRARIIPTIETISKNPVYTHKYKLNHVKS
jgi:hypothetical protein